MHISLSRALLEEIALKTNYDVESIKILDGIKVDQHKQREIVENMINYPSLISKLATAVREKGISKVDVKYSHHAIESKPHWVNLTDDTYTLIVNT